MAIKAIITDLGGVLVLQKQQAQQQEWEEQSGVTIRSLFQQIEKAGLNRAATLGKITSDEVWKQMAERTKLDPQLFVRLEENFFAAEVLNQALLDFLQSLRPERKLAALSNAWSGVREGLEHKFKSSLSQYFDLQVFSCEAGLAKPDTRIYQLALYRLKLYPEETIFLDNNLANVDAARLLGMQSIHYKDNEQAIMALKKVLAL